MTGQRKRRRLAWLASVLAGGLFLGGILVTSRWVAYALLGAAAVLAFAVLFSVKPGEP